MWQAGPAGETSTSSASRSQSSRTDSTSRTLPLVAPFSQSSWRERDQKVARRVVSVCARASAFIHAIISTVPSTASWQTAGISPASS